MAKAKSHTPGSTRKKPAGRLAWFRRQVYRARGGNDQTLINGALRDYVRKASEPLEDTARRIIRDELRRAS